MTGLAELAVRDKKYGCGLSFRSQQIIIASPRLARQPTYSNHARPDDSAASFAD